MKLREFLKIITSDHIEVFTTTQQYDVLSYGDDRNVFCELLDTKYIDCNICHIVHDETRNKIVIYIKED